MEMGDSRVDRIPKWFATKFPEYRGQTLKAFLKKHKPFTWRGYDRTPEHIRKQIVAEINSLLERKAGILSTYTEKRTEVMKRSVGTYTTQEGKKYPLIEGGIIFIGVEKGARIYEIFYDTEKKRITKTPAWFPRGTRRRRKGKS